MAPKELTPKQLSSGLSYVHKEAPFLAKLKSQTTEQKTKTPKFEDYIDGQDDEDYDELEGAQIVELDKHGKEIHKDDGAKSDADEEEKGEEDEEQKEKDRPPPVDEKGRILFRPSAKTNSSMASKRKLQSIIDEEIKKTSSEKDNAEEKGPAAKKNRKKNKKNAVKSLLSFNEED